MMEPLIFLIPTLLFQPTVSALENEEFTLKDEISLSVEAYFDIELPKYEEKVEEEVVDDRPWHEQHQVVAHALGEIDSRVETNSREAFFSSYEKGIRVFEVDFQFTSDGILVARHDFEHISYYNLEQAVLNGDTSMDSDRFISEKINHKYTSLTARDLIALLQEHEDAYLVTDSKDTDTATVQAQFYELVEIIRETGDSTLFDRIIVQFYHEEMYHTVREIYPFQDWIFTMYQLNEPDLDVVGAFCQENGVEVVTMNYDVLEKEKTDILMNYGIKTYVHTINRLNDVYFADLGGADGYYSDILSPSDVILVVEPEEATVEDT